MTDTELDSYYDSTPDSILSLFTPYPTSTGSGQAIGQCFKPSLTYRITSVQFELRKFGNPSGDLKARLYLMNANTYGNGGKPSTDAYPVITTPLGVSDAVEASSLDTSFSWITFTFTGSQKYLMTAETAYCICFMSELGANVDSSNYIQIAGSLVGTHLGNCFIYYDNTPPVWGGYASSVSRDRNFKVYGEPLVEIKGLKGEGVYGWDSTNEVHIKFKVDSDGILQTS